MPPITTISCAAAMCLQLLFGVGAVGAAPSTDPRIAITTFTTHNVSQGDRQVLARSLGGGLSGAGLRVLPRAAVSRALAGWAGLLGCETSVCLARIGEVLRAPLGARAVVEDTGGGTYRIALTVSLTKTGRKASSAVRHCAPCTAVEAAEAISRMARTAGRRAVRALRAARVARRAPPRRRRATPNGGQAHKPVKWRHRAWIIAGGALMTAGALALIPGVVLMALDGRDRPGRDPTRERRQVWDSRAVGIAATAVGAACLATGVGLLIYGLLKKQQAQSRAPVVISAGPVKGGALVMGRFLF